MILRQTVLTLVSLVALPLFALASLLTVWASDREAPNVLHRVWLVPSVVRPCEVVEVWIDRTMLRETGVHIERFLIDSGNKRSDIQVLTMKRNPGPMGRYAYSIEMTVPCNFSPGWAHYMSTTYYYRNPLQEYFWPLSGGERALRFCVITDVLAPEQVCRT